MSGNFSTSICFTSTSVATQWECGSEPEVSCQSPENKHDMDLSMVLEMSTQSEVDHIAGAENKSQHPEKGSIYEK